MPSVPRIPLRSISAKNFRSLADVEVNFGRFSVLVGPNGSGKSNLLKVLQFVSDTARFDVVSAIEMHGGFESLHRDSAGAGPIQLELTGVVTTFASESAPDEYSLELSVVDGRISRTEGFLFKRVQGRGRRIGFTTAGAVARVGDVRSQRGAATGPVGAVTLADDSRSALGALARITTEEIGDGPRQFVDFLSSVRYLDPNVEQARQPSRYTDSRLADDAANLSSALKHIADTSPDSFEALSRDLRECLPGMRGVEFLSIGGAARSLVAAIRESGIEQPIELAQASFGTVRVLSLLAALHDPAPPALTVIEEVDHGLHPYALDVVVRRMREASSRTQIIAASHSPTLVNRLRAEELIVTDRNPLTGESIIAVADPAVLAEAAERSGLGLGELWYAGSLGGVPVDA